MAAMIGRYERPLISYSHGLLRDLDAARDVVQDVFIRYAQLTGPESGENPARPDPVRLDAWLFTACRNRCMDHLRKFSRIVPLESGYDGVSPEETPSATMERNDTAAWLFAFVDRLSANQRECILLRFQHGSSYQEIADITGLTATNVGFILHTALKRLRTLLAEEACQEFPEHLRVSG
jgi:RNA polymerase sigma-70 factor (ECF subfamily)